MSSGTSDEGPVTKTNVGRLTNAIFVFTLLLLFKNVRLPSFADTLNEASVEKFGYMQIPDIMSFINAFIIIALFWIITFHIFHQLKRIDRAYLYLHFGLLAMIVFIPITSHMYQIFDGNSLIALFFHINVFLISILLLTEWDHCKVNPDLLIPGCLQERGGCFSRKLLYIPITAVIGIILSFYDIPMTRNLYYITMIIFFIDWVVTSNHPCRILGGNHE
jgi:uncharacterized membrane protein